MPIPRRRHQRQQEPEHYFEVDLLPAERDRLIGLLEKDTPGPSRTELLLKLETATRINLPLRAPVDWAEVEAEMARTRRSLPDLIFDMARQHDRVWFPRRKR